MLFFATAADRAPAETRQCGDVDGDGAITVFDAHIVLRYAIQLTDPVFSGCTKQLGGRYKGCSPMGNQQIGWSDSTMLGCVRSEGRDGAHDCERRIEPAKSTTIMNANGDNFIGSADAAMLNQVAQGTRDRATLVCRPVKP